MKPWRVELVETVPRTVWVAAKSSDDAKIKAEAQAIHAGAIRAEAIDASPPSDDPIDMDRQDLQHAAEDALRTIKGGGDLPKELTNALRTYSIKNQRRINEVVVVNVVERVVKDGCPKTAALEVAAEKMNKSVKWVSGAIYPKKKG